MKRNILHLLIFLSIVFCTAFNGLEVKADQFPDVVKGSWYEEAVIDLTNKGVIHGFPDGTFKPDQNIKYDEFVKLLVTALGYEAEQMTGYWAAQYIQEAQRRQYLFDHEVLDYTRNINRGEMARLLSRAYGEADPYVLEEYQKNMNDYINIDIKYKEHALVCYFAGLMNGIDGNFEASFEVTRKEACVIIYRMINPDKRVINKPQGSCESFVETDELVSRLREIGYEINDTYEDMILTKEKASMIIYDTIMQNQELRRKFVPLSKEVEYPVVFTKDDFHMSEAFERIIGTTRSISQNLSSMQLFEIVKSYEDGRIRRILNYNVFSDRNALIGAEKSIEGFRELSTRSHRMPFDHTRFEVIFSDSEIIGPKYAESLFKLYDYGIFDTYSLSEYSYRFHCSPKSFMTMQEIDNIIQRLTDESLNDAIDEKIFGHGESWGYEKFGSELYTIRLSELKTVYKYDIISGYDPQILSITPGDRGYIAYMAILGYPYFDDFFLILDDCLPGEYNNKESTSIEIFLEYDIHKYKNLVPAGFSKMIETDLLSFLDDKESAVFEKNYGGMNFGISKTMNDRVTFWYAFREG